MPWRIMLLSLAALATSPLAAQAPGNGAEGDVFAAKLADDELADLTGKFILPGGVEVAMTVTSDTVLNGQTLLRTVLAIDQSSTLSVYGRSSGASGQMSTAAGASPAAATSMPGAPTGIAVAFDRHSGIQTITPTFSAAGQPNVSIGGAAPPDAAAQGLERLAVTPNGPAVQTPDGLVSVRTLTNGTLVNLTGDQLAASHLVGQSIATALVNSGNDRMFDTVTNVNIDLRNVTPYQIGAAAMQADTLALEATRGMIR